jgi:hypothetical protein
MGGCRWTGQNPYFLTRVPGDSYSAKLGKCILNEWWYWKPIKFFCYMKQQMLLLHITKKILIQNVLPILGLISAIAWVFLFCFILPLRVTMQPFWETNQIRWGPTPRSIMEFPCGPSAQLPATQSVLILTVCYQHTFRSHYSTCKHLVINWIYKTFSPSIT